MSEEWWPAIIAALAAIVSAIISSRLTACALRKNDILKEERENKNRQQEIILILFDEIEFLVDAIKYALPTLEMRKTGTRPADLVVCRLYLLKLSDYNEVLFATFITYYKYLPREVSEIVFRFF